MLGQKLRHFILANKYLFLILLTVLVFFFPVFKGEIPFPGDLLLNFYEPYKAYPILNYPTGAAVPTKNQGADVVRHMFPWKSFTIDSIKHGQIPFWDPYNFSGNPLMANFQSAVFYPLNVLFFIFPFLTAWTLFTFITPVLSAFFTCLFLRELKISKLASVFGGLTFAFSSYMVVWLEYGNIDHTFLWLPLGLFFTEKIIKDGNLKYNLCLILTLFMSLVAGYIQGYFYVVGVVFVYFFAKSFLNKTLEIRKSLYFLAVLIFPVLLSLFQILPTKMLFDNSTRSIYTLPQIQHLLNPWWYGITAIVPNFFGNPAANNHWFFGTYIERVSYIGIIPFILFVYALLNFKKRKEIIIFALLAVLSFFLSLDLFVTKYFFQIPIPMISTTVPTRELCIFEFCAIVLAAVGFDLMREKFNKKTLAISIFFVSVLLLLSWGFTFLGAKLLHVSPTNLAVTRKNLILPTGMLLSFVVLTFSYFKKIKLTLVLIVAFTLFDLFYFFNRITPFSPPQFVYPKTPIISFIQKNAGINRFWGYGSGYIESNFQTYDKTFSPEGVDPIHIKGYARFLESSLNGKAMVDLPRPDANIAPGYGSTDLKDNHYRQRVLDLLGVKYVLNKNRDRVADNITFPVEVYNFSYHDGYYQAYENKEALPRAFLASDYVVETNKQKILDKIFDSKVDLKKTLVLEEKPDMNFVPDSSASVKIDSYGNNEVDISTDAKTNMLLFLSDTHSDNWGLKVDGEESKLYRADYAFRAVAVPAGNHKVRFYYLIKPFLDGLKLSLLSLAVLIVLFPILRRYEKKK